MAIARSLLPLGFLGGAPLTDSQETNELGATKQSIETSA